MARGGRVCTFFQQGRCKFGANCKFDHPGYEDGQGLQQGGRRGGVQVDAYRPSQQSNNRSRDDAAPHHLDRGVIEEDLTTGKPNWPFSCYGPGRDAPKQLFEGEIEVSPEEARLKFYLARAQGNEQQAIQEEQQSLDQITGQIQTALNNLNGAIEYVIQGKGVHPNRLDVCEEGSKASQQGAPAPGIHGGAKTTFGQPTQSAFGQPSNTGGAFGKPSAPGSAFGQPSQPSAFGQPSNPGSTFGKPSQPAFGQPLTSVGGFGKPSQPAFGQPSQPSAFGQPSQPSAFGQPSQPSAFGQPSQPSTFGQQSQPSAFGQPSQPSAFGQPSQAPLSQASKPAAAQSTFGQPSNSGSAFGQPSKPGVSPFAAPAQNKPSPFAAAAQNQQQQPKLAFGQPAQPSAFGQPSQPSTFGQPSNPAAKPSPFAAAAAAQTSNTPFGAPTGPKASSPFSQPSSFGQPSQTQTSTFGQPSRPQPNGFGQPSQPSSSTFGQPSKPQAGGFGQPSQPTPQINGFTQQQPPQAATGPTGTSTPATNLATPPLSSYAQHGANKRLTRWKNQVVRYVPEGGKKENPIDVPVFNDPANGGKETRVWSPDGPPEQLSKDVQAEDESVYEVGALAEVLKEAYSVVNAVGEFKDAIMPEVPPKSDWVGWDI